jgi:hypothetical protein
MNSDNKKKIEKYSHWWNSIVRSNFNTEAIIFALNNVGDENENEFIDFMKRKFIRRTIDEWMRFYETDYKLREYNKLKKFKLLLPHIKDEKIFIIQNTKYEEIAIGNDTLQNLKNFEMKYILEISQAQAISTGIESISDQKNEKPKNRKKVNTSNEVIAEEVIKMWDNGVEEFERIYKTLSENSEKLFAEKLSIGQIKGKYQRFAVNHKEFKRKNIK